MQIFVPSRAVKRTSNIGAALCLLLSGLAAFALAIYPIYIIRPFTQQQPTALARALWVLLHYKPILFVAATLIVVLAIRAWLRGGWVTRVVLVPAVGIALFASASTWINPYEQLMFHPIGKPQYISINQATIDPNDMVIAVTLGAESRAYPIREMGYHHVVNDRLNQLPIVVTY